MTDLFSAMATGSEASLRIIPFLHQKHRVVAAFFTPSHAARTSSVRQMQVIPGWRCISPLIDKKLLIFPFEPSFKSIQKKKTTPQTTLPQKIASKNKNKKTISKSRRRASWLGILPVNMQHRLARDWLQHWALHHGHKVVQASVGQKKMCQQNGHPWVL